MRRILLLFVLGFASAAAVCRADILKIDDRTDKLTAFLEFDDKTNIGSIDSLDITNERIAIVYKLPVGFTFLFDRDIWGQMINPQGADDPAGTVSDVYEVNWSAGSDFAAIILTSDTDNGVAPRRVFSGGTQQPNILEDGDFQAISTNGLAQSKPFNLTEFTVLAASDVPVPEPSMFIPLGAALAALAMWLRRSHVEN